MGEIWRWDQGRLSYFAIDNLRLISSVLMEMSGTNLNPDDGSDPLRGRLGVETGLPFLPVAYKVWRNYARVFGCSLLATQSEGKLLTTELCRLLAETGDSRIENDDYFVAVIQSFAYPSPAFSGYDGDRPAIFPFVALLKYLLAKTESGEEGSASLDDVFSLLVGRGATGLESIESYSRLPGVAYSPQGDERRQLREMLIFISQLSILKYYGDRLYLDVAHDDLDGLAAVRGLCKPRLEQRHEQAPMEMLRLGGGVGVRSSHLSVLPGQSEGDLQFTEGKRVRVSHLRIERSPRLRKLYLSTYPGASSCDMCRMDTDHRYPWTRYLVEIHHLLPLSAAVGITGRGVSLEDLIALCPSCHKSVHAYYKTWLGERGLDDFEDAEQAETAYYESKARIQLGGA